MRSTWKVLNLPSASNAALPLVIKSEIGTSDYTVWISDLTLIWKESLDRKRIIRRSFDVDTSIDPSEDSDQLRLFLQKIGDALEQKPGTTMDLVRSDSDKSLLLQTVTPLPGSLKSLEWTIELLPAPQSTLTAELVVPLLNQQAIANTERISLLQHLREKDQVIAKLTDRMQSDGVDFGRLFPGIASKSSKSMSRHTLGRSVKGFDEFDEGQWLNYLANNIASARTFVELISDTFGMNSKDQPEALQMPEYKNWWEQLRHKDSQPTRTVNECHHADVEEGHTQHKFQRQSFPTKIRSSSPSREGGQQSTRSEDVKAEGPTQQQRSGDSTTDESDQDIQSPQREPLPLKKRSTSHDKALSDSPRMSPQAKLDKQVEDKAFLQSMPLRGVNTPGSHLPSSDDESPHAASDIARRDTPDQAPAYKTRAKLGKIGGKGKIDQSNASHQQLSLEPPVLAGGSTSSLSPSVTKTRIESERSSRTSIQPQAPPPPRETSQDRANRNRERLKRELEVKSQTGAKKKRRF